MVAIGSAPILAGALALVVRGERPSRRWFIATSLAVTGCSLLIFGGHSAVGHNLSPDVWGVLLALGAGGAYAIYAVASKQLLDRQQADTATAVVFCLGALLLTPILFTADLSWLVQPAGLAVALHLGLVATAAAYTFFVRGLTRGVPIATAVTLSLAEPLTAGFLGVALLGERLTPAALWGIAFLFTGLALLSRGQARGQSQRET
jgi:DME family drug/metabolite transporter